MPALCPRTYPVSSLKHVLRFLLIAEMLLVLMTACSSSAKVVNVTTCSGADLAAAFREANRTPEPDTLELNGECTYLLSAWGQGEYHALFVDTPITLNGHGAALETAASIRIFYVDSKGELTLNRVTIRKGKLTGQGYSTTYSVGAGIHNLGKVTLSDSTVADNSIVDTRGAGAGGGIDNKGKMIIVNSTISRNSTFNVAGGIYNTGEMTITNSTISANSARGSASGILNEGTLTFNFVTLAYNSPAGSSRQIGSNLVNSGTVVVKNSVIAAALVGGRTNCTGKAIKALGVNMSNDDSCGVGPAKDPLLGPLADNGGTTLTVAPPEVRGMAIVSPIVDAVTDCTDTQGNQTSTDQRGEKRPKGKACDIGALEID